MRTTAKVLGLGIVFFFIFKSVVVADWTHYAGDAARSSLVAVAPAEFDVAWVAQPASNEEFVVNSTPVATGGRVFHLARAFDNAGDHTHDRVIAFDAASGVRVWTAIVAPDRLQSWSSPAVDTRNGTVLVCTGSSLTALRADNGATAWLAALPEPVVNASPVVTSDLATSGVPANRAFITGFSSSPGARATFTAVNVDAPDPAGNPFEPGDVVWSVAIAGLTGNSPAYASGAVYVASTSGTIRAFDAVSGNPLWATPIVNQAFFGGVTLRGGYLYAASYRFTYGQNNSRLVKLRATDGALIWSTPCERTATIPVVTSTGLIVLSGGIDDAGSAVKVQAWQDDGATVSPLWDTFVASGGAVWLGGWTSQPVVAGNAAFIGVPQSDTFSPFESLVRLDLTRSPDDPRFIARIAPGAGGSASVAGDGLFSFGQGGLYCFRAPQRRTPANNSTPLRATLIGARRW